MLLVREERAWCSLMSLLGRLNAAFETIGMLDMNYNHQCQSVSNPSELDFCSSENSSTGYSAPSQYAQHEV